MQKRTALVIGNSAYSNVSRLKNPIKDAMAIARTLSSLDFHLVGGQPFLDANREEIESGIVEFQKELGRNSVALFYFSGHGLQLGGANYIVPIEAGAAQETHIEAQLVDVGKLLAGMERADSQLNILILDACRSDPFHGRSLRSTTGLAPMQARSGTIISYATQPGNVALDGAGDNSPFMLALLEVLGRPELDALNVFNEVGILVRQRTGGHQVPWVTNSPVEARFIFNPQKTRPTDHETRREINAWWQKAKPTSDPVTPAEMLVSATAAGAYRTIREALADAKDDATIVIEPGTYTGDCVIERPVTLKGRGSRDQVIIQKSEGDGSAILKVHADLTLRNLTVRAQVRCHGIVVLKGNVQLEDCAITRVPEGSPEEEEPRRGVWAFGQDNEIDLILDGCAIEGFDMAVAAEHPKTRLDINSCAIRGSWQHGAKGGNQPRGILVARGASLSVAGETSVEGCGWALTVWGGSTADVTGVRVVRCYVGLGIEDQGSSASMKASELDEVGWGVYANVGTRVSVSDCDIVYRDFGVQTHGGIVEIQRTKRIRALEPDGYGVAAQDGATVTLSDNCRIFGGARGVSAAEASTVNVSQCEIFDVTNECVRGDANSILHLRASDLHHSADAGVRSFGRLTIQDQCLIRSNKFGVTGLGTSFLLKDSFVYQNTMVGVYSSEAVQAKIENCTIVLQNGWGICADDRSRLEVVQSVMRQNGAGAGMVEGEAQATLNGCDLRRNGFVEPPIEASSGARLTLTQTSIDSSRCPSNDGSGGEYNSLSDSAFFFAQSSQVIDLLGEFSRDNMREWSREAPRTSSNGREITFAFAISFEIRVDAPAESWLERIRQGLEAGQGGSVGSDVVLPYELRFTAVIVTEPALPGIDKVTVTVSEEEHINRYGHVQIALGRHRSAPSVICRERWGCYFLRFLEKRLTPARYQGS